MFWYGAMIYLLPVWMKLLCTHTHNLSAAFTAQLSIFPSFLKLSVGVHFWLFTLGNFSWESNCVTLAGIHATAVRICWWALQRDWWEFMFIHSHGADIYSEDIYSMGKWKFVLSIFKKKKKKARVNSAKSCILLWIFWSSHCCNCLFHGNYIPIPHKNGAIKWTLTAKPI